MTPDPSVGDAAGEGRAIAHAPDGTDRAEAARPAGMAGQDGNAAVPSDRILTDRAAVVDACCDAEDAVIAEAGRLRSFCAEPRALRSARVAWPVVAAPDVRHGRA